MLVTHSGSFKEKCRASLKSFHYTDVLKELSCKQSEFYSTSLLIFINPVNEITQKADGTIVNINLATITLQCNREYPL